MLPFQAKTAKLDFVGFPDKIYPEALAEGSRQADLSYFKDEILRPTGSGLSLGISRQRQVSVNMECIVIGGAGFIGSHLVDLLLTEGHAVRILDNFSTGRWENINPKSTLLEGDVRDISLLKDKILPGDTLFHLAALPRIQPSFEDPVLHEEVNVGGVLNLFQAAKEANARKIIFSSSAAVYGDTSLFPTPESAPIDCLSPYALQKYAAERYLLMLGARYSISVICLRYFNVYGPRSYNPQDKFNAYSPVIGIFKEQVDAGLPITITGSGKQSRDFIHVYDVAWANLCAALSECSGEVFNVGSGQSYSIQHIASLMGKEIRYIDERLGEIQFSQANIDKIKSLLQWQPQLSLEEGLMLL